MKINKFLSDDDAVSPVIGVILMVAITVILAAVIATFVLGLGDSVSNNAPQAQLEFDYAQDYSDGNTPDNDGVAITHTGGDELTKANLQITIDGSEILKTNGDIDTSGNIVGTGTGDTANPSSDPITAGDGYTIVEDSSNDDTTIEGDDSVRVIWSNPDGGNTAVIGESTVNF